ncbi:hypothetical protein BDL97_11G040700 [Sphagnum fallax]|nr:hypothetical protein BDL97_11G040700 [Sphagnum fallax]
MNGSDPVLLEVGTEDKSPIAHVTIVRACFVRKCHGQRFLQGAGSPCRGQNTDVESPIKRPCSRRAREAGAERKRGRTSSAAWVVQAESGVDRKRRKRGAEFRREVEGKRSGEEERSDGAKNCGRRGRGTFFFRVLIHRRNRPRQSDSENEIWLGQSDLETRQRGHEKSRKNQATSARQIPKEPSNECTRERERLGVGSEMVSPKIKARKVRAFVRL